MADFQNTQSITDEPPLPWGSVDQDQVTAIEVDYQDEAGGLHIAIWHDGTGEGAWRRNLDRITARTNAQAAVFEDHMIATRWRDLDGVWHDTLEGEILAAGN